MPKTLNYNMQKDTQDDFYNVDTVNGNLDIIDRELKKNNDEANKKINIVVTSTPPPTSEREDKTFYFKVTDTQSIQGNDIKVSPNMGLKIL